MTPRETGLKALARSINALLRLDPESLQRLASLDGKLIEIDVRSPSFRFFVEPMATGVRLCAEATRSPDTTISGSAIGLARNSFGNDPRGALLSGDVRIGGDLQTGAALRSILDGLDIDWEEQVSHVAGDVVAHQLGNVARGLRRWVSESAGALQQDLGEYLREESRLLADRHDSERFIAEVDVLRADVDRLQQRVDRLGRALKREPGEGGK